MNETTNSTEPTDKTHTDGNVGEQRVVMLLGPNEKRIFAHYCLQTVSDLDAMNKQMESIGVPEEMLKRNRSRIAAFMIVYGELDSAEEISIGAQDVGPVAT